MSSCHQRKWISLAGSLSESRVYNLIALDILPPLAEIFISSRLEPAFESLKFTAERKRFFRIPRLESFSPFFSRRPRIEPPSFFGKWRLFALKITRSRLKRKGSTDEIPGHDMILFFRSFYERFEKVACLCAIRNEGDALNCWWTVNFSAVMDRERRSARIRPLNETLTNSYNCV